MSHCKPFKTGIPTGIEQRKIIYTAKVLTLGDPSSAKTVLLRAFAHGNIPKCPTEPLPMTFENARKRIPAPCINGVQVIPEGEMDLLLWETSDNGDDILVGELSDHQDVHCVLLCYSADCPESFSSIMDWNTEVIRSLPKVPVILVATNIEKYNDDQQKTVGRAQGQQMALGINAYAFVECSVELNINVDAVFHMVAKGVLEFKLKAKESGKKKSPSPEELLSSRMPTPGKWMFQPHIKEKNSKRERKEKPKTAVEEKHVSAPLGLVLHQHVAWAAPPQVVEGDPIKVYEVKESEETSLSAPIVVDRRTISSAPLLRTPHEGIPPPPAPRQQGDARQKKSTSLLPLHRSAGRPCRRSKVAQGRSNAVAEMK